MKRLRNGSDERFEVLQRLGEGTYSVVYECTDADAKGGHVAVKVIKRLDSIVVENEPNDNSLWHAERPRKGVNSTLVQSDNTAIIEDKVSAVHSTDWTSWKIHKHPPLEDRSLSSTGELHSKSPESVSTTSDESCPLRSPTKSTSVELNFPGCMQLRTKYPFIPCSVLREIFILSFLVPHPHIVELKDVVLPSISTHEKRSRSGPQRIRTDASPSNVKTGIDPSALCLVFGYMPDGDLRHFLTKHPDLITQNSLKRLFHQLLLSVAHLHRLGVLHRDIKPHNILVDKSRMEVKLTDFNLATVITNENPSWPDSLRNPLTNTVVTLWYRSPEVLLGSTIYDGGIDTWGLGCVLWEMAHPTEGPLFRGTNEVEQLMRIYQLLGTPGEKLKATSDFQSSQRAKQRDFFMHDHRGFEHSMQAVQRHASSDCIPSIGSASILFSSTPGLETLPYFSSDFPQWRGAPNLEQHAPGLSANGANLLHQLLEIDPRQRITAMAALSHPWFFES